MTPYIVIPVLALIGIYALIQRLLKMPPVQKTTVKKHQRAFLFENDDFVSILSPGDYWLVHLIKKKRIECFDIDTPEFSHPRLDFIATAFPKAYQEHFIEADLGDTQAGFLYQNGKLKRLLAPGTRTRFWKGVVDTQIQVQELKDALEIPKEELAPLKALAGTSSLITLEEIQQHEIGLLSVDGEFVKTLAPGLHGFWRALKHIQIPHVDLRVKALEVAGQEILTKDKVTLRLNVTAQYKVSDPVKALQTVNDYSDFLYKAIQFAIRDAVGTQLLDELLANKDSLNATLLAGAQKATADYGLTVEAIGIKDVILPGEMREIFNQVVEAEKAAQANLIKRREETAATRSLLNTAKLMEDNPTLLRLKELESLEKVTQKVQNLTVLSGVDGLMKQLVTLKSSS